MTTNLPETLRPRTFLRIDHLGIAVPSLEAFVPVYEALFGAPFEHIEKVASETVSYTPLTLPPTLRRLVVGWCG